MQIRLDHVDHVDNTPSKKKKKQALYIHKKSEQLAFTYYRFSPICWRYHESSNIRHNLN